LVGYTLLKPEEGLSLLRDTLKNPGNSFRRRFDALQAVRFLHDFRPDRAERKQLLEALWLLLDQRDIADLAIEALRRHRYAAATGRVLAVYDEQSPPIVRRAVIRFGLSFPGDPQAVEFTGRVRLEQPELVKDIEEFIKL